MSRAPSHKCLQHPPAVVAGVHETTLGIRKNKGFTLRVWTLLLPEPQIVRQSAAWSGTRMV
jgi:hypothetical protein